MSALRWLAAHWPAVLGAWFLLSFPVACLVGRFLAGPGAPERPALRVIRGGRAA